jgi:thymidylate synthase
MKHYHSVDSMWTDALIDLISRGHTSTSRIGSTLATHGYVARLQSTNWTFLTNKRRKLDPRYAAAEFFWYFDPTGSLAMIRHYAPQYINFADHGVVMGAYGPRIRASIHVLLDLLQNTPDTRRAVLPIFSSEDLDNANWAKDIPCNISWTFLVEDHKLCMIANMRSNDVWLGMPYDIFVNTCILRFVADCVDMTPGWYQHQAADLHLYAKNNDAAHEAIEQGFDLKMTWDSMPKNCWDDLTQALACERGYREARIKPRENRAMIEDLLRCVSDREPISESLKNARNRR